MDNLSNVVVTIRLSTESPADRERLALLVENYLANSLLAEDLFDYQDGWAASLSGDDEAALEAYSFEWEVVDWDVQEAGSDSRDHIPE